MTTHVACGCAYFTISIFQASIAFRCSLFDTSTEKTLLKKKQSTWIQVKQFLFLIANTLHPSHVIAPKWTPDDDALHTQQGKRLKISATVGLFGFSIKRNKRLATSNECSLSCRADIPLIVIPTSLHFWKRQNWHWVRVVRIMTQSWFRIHLYLVSSPFILLRKNF